MRLVKGLFLPVHLKILRSVAKFEASYGAEVSNEKSGISLHGTDLYSQVADMLCEHQCDRVDTYSTVYSPGHLLFYFVGYQGSEVTCVCNNIGDVTPEGFTLKSDLILQAAEIVHRKVPILLGLLQLAVGGVILLLVSFGIGLAIDGQGWGYVMIGLALAISVSGFLIGWSGYRRRNAIRLAITEVMSIAQRVPA